MKFSIRLNNDLPIKDYLRLARAAEQVGFDQFWVSNDLFIKSGPVILSAIATATERIGIGTCILNPYTIHASEIAMFAATMDELSNNRFHLGLAAGAKDFMDWVGLEHRRPLAAVRETVDVVSRLLSGQSAESNGEFHRFTQDAYLRFEPSRSTPIYIGALGPKMLELAGEVADGALPLLFPPEHYFTVRPLIDKGLHKRSDARGFDLAACVWVSIASDEAAATRVLAEKIAYYGYALSPLILERLSLSAEDFAPIQRAIHQERDLDKACAMVDDRMLRIGVVGRAKDLIQRLEPLVEAGARHLSFGPPLGPDPEFAIRQMGSEVLPYFRD